jgi:hypothetical protein
VRRLTSALAAALICLSASACGIGQGRVIEDRTVESNARSNSSGTLGPPMRDVPSLNTPKQLIEHYLQASAGDLPRRQTVLDSYGPAFNAAGNHTVIRLPPDSDFPSPVTNQDGTQTMQLPVEFVGVLRDDGQLVPTDRAAEVLTFTATRDDEGLLLTSAPQELLLSEQGLNNYYRARPLYFWSGPTLVQDLRYLPNMLTVEQQSQELLSWLYDQPADWLAESVKRPPLETKPSDAVTQEGEQLLVNLAKPVAQQQDFDALALQLARTLLENQNGSLRIMEQGQVRVPEYRLPAAGVVPPPKRYTVVDGTLTRLKRAGDPAAPPLALPAQLQDNIVLASVAQRESAVAVVQTTPAGQRLAVTTSPSSFVVFDQLTRPGKAIGQPVWLDSGHTLLVPVDGVVYRVEVEPQQVAVEAELPGLTGLAVAPDGHRLALVIAGRLYLGSRNDNGVISKEMRLVPTGFTSVQAAAFLDIGFSNKLIAAGSARDGVYLATMNLDGSQRSTPYSQIYQQGTIIRRLVAKAGQALYEVQGVGALEAQQGGGQTLVNSVDWAGASPRPPSALTAPSFEG